MAECKIKSGNSHERWSDLIRSNVHVLLSSSTMRELGQRQNNEECSIRMQISRS